MRRSFRLKYVWLGGRDSNPDSQIQSLVSYHWTTSQQRTRIYVSRPANVNRVVLRATPATPSCHKANEKSAATSELSCFQTLIKAEYAR